MVKNNGNGALLRDTYTISVFVYTYEYMRYFRL